MSRYAGMSREQLEELLDEKEHLIEQASNELRLRIAEHIAEMDKLLTGMSRIVEESAIELEAAAAPPADTSNLMGEGDLPL